MPTTDLFSLLLGAVVGFVGSMIGFRIRHEWERFDADQLACRTELIELSRSAELARIAVREGRMREGALVLAPTSSDGASHLLSQYAAVAESLFEFSSRTRRLRPGPLRMASGGYAVLLRSYHVGADDPPTTEELDSAGQVLRALIDEAIDRTEHAHGVVVALRGERLCCPPVPYSAPFRVTRS